MWLAVAWAALTGLAFTGCALFLATPSVRPFWPSFLRTKTYRSQTLDRFQRTEQLEGGRTCAEYLAKVLSSRDPSYWPTELTATPLFQTVWPEWQASRPEWMTEEWESCVPVRFHTALEIQQ